MKRAYNLIATLALLPAAGAFADIQTTGFVSPAMTNGSTSFSNTTTSMYIGALSAIFSGTPMDGSVTVTAGATVTTSVVNIGNNVGTTGTVTVTDAGSMWNSASNLNIGVSGTGTWNQLAGASSTVANVSIGGNTGSHGSMTIDAASLVATGIITGSLGTGTLVIRNGSTITSTRKASIGNAPTGVGTVSLTGSAWSFTSTFPANAGLVVGGSGNGTLTVGGGGVLSFAAVNNLTIANSASATGVLNLQSGGIIDMGGNNFLLGSGNATFNFTGGTLKNAAAIGTATIPFNVLQQGGQLAAGTSTSVIGTTTINGGYTLAGAGTLGVDLGGSGGVGGTDFDYYAITGAAALGGTLSVSKAGGFSPVPGTTFNLLTAASINAAGLVCPGPFSYAVVSGGNGQILQVTALAPGDATGDGSINIDDYTAIDAGYLHLGEATWANGDFNGDGTIDFLDYAIIDAAYASQNGGQSAGEISLHTAEFGPAYVAALNSITAVPEPASLAVVVLGTAALLKRRERR